MGLLKSMCAAEVGSGDFYGPSGMSGEVVKLVPEPLITDADAGKLLVGNTDS